MLCGIALDPEIPLHLSRFFPRHLYADKDPAPRGTMYEAGKIAERYLKNVFYGNMGGWYCILADGMI
jgi:pyruvate formate lyase activating enzyme